MKIEIIITFSLEAYDRNNDFGQDLDQEDDHVMSISPLTEFRDSNSNTTGLQSTTVLNYLQKFDATLTPGRRLYKDRYYSLVFIKTGTMTSYFNMFCE